MEMIKQYVELLKPLFDDYDKKFEPATEKQIFDFSEKCKQRKVPVSVSEQLVEFYRITKGGFCLNGFSFHEIDDEILFEWWNNNEIWLGNCNDDVLRWGNGCFCLGDASNVAYSDEYQFHTMIGLLQKGFQEWFQ
jgi:hypothetical protein